MQADIYVRLSEAAAGDDAGVRRQEQECREFCERQGFTVRRVHRDNDLSATTGVMRPGFEELLASSPEVIVCWHTDRLVRLSTDLERVLSLGVNVHGLRAGYLDLSTPAGRAVARTITAWSQYEGEQKAERQRSAARQRAAEGRKWWPRRPFGFEMDGSHHPEEAAALRAAYASLLAGGTIAGIERAWSGFTTNTGRPWRASSIRPVLMNARNAGIRVYEGHEVGPAAWEGIVTEEVYRATVRLLQDPARKAGGGTGGKGRRENLATGLAECGRCGAGVRTQWRGVKGEPGAYRVYQCTSGGHVTHRADVVDGLIVAVLFSMPLQDPGAMALAAGGDDEGLAELHEERRELQDRLDGLMDDFADGLISREQRVRGSERVASRLTQVEQALAQAGLRRSDGQLLSAEQLQVEWPKLDMNAKHALASAYLGRVRLLPMGKGRKVATHVHFEVWERDADKPLDLSKYWMVQKAPEE